MVAILVTVAGGGYYAFRRLLPPPPQEATGPVYAASPVVRGDISVGVELTGSLNPTQGGGIMVPFNPGPGPVPQVNMTVAEVLVKDGDRVQQGQVLVRLAGGDVEEQLRSKEKSLQAERKSLAGLVGLPPERLDEVDPAQGITLRAPIAGRVTGLDVKEGQAVKQGQIVAKVVDDSRFRVAAWLVPLEAGAVKPGQRVLLRFEEFADFVEGTVTDVSPEPVPTPASELRDSFESYGSKDKDAYHLVYPVVVTGRNAGLVRPGAPVQVGVPAGDGVSFWRYYGKVEGYAAEEQVLSGATALVTRLHVRNMQKVPAGAPLVTLAGADARDLIQERLARIRDLEAEVRQLRARLGDLFVRAPLTGVVGHIEARPGMTAQPGQWMGDIFNPLEMQMFAMVDDVDVLRVRQGAPVRVTLDALPGKELRGSVQQVAMMGKNERGVSQFQVIVKVTGTPDLRPGMQARAYVEEGSARGVLLAPLEAVFEEDGKSKVEVLLPDGTVKVVPVELGLMNDRYAEIKAGLKEGDRVVTGSTADILPSERIRSGNLLPGAGQGPGGGQGGAAGQGGGGPGGAPAGAPGAGPGGAPGGAAGDSGPASGFPGGSLGKPGGPEGPR